MALDPRVGAHSRKGFSVPKSPIRLFLLPALLAAIGALALVLALTDRGEETLGPGPASPVGTPPSPEARTPVNSREKAPTAHAPTDLEKDPIPGAAGDPLAFSWPSRGVATAIPSARMS